MKIKEIQLMTNELAATETFYNHTLGIKTADKTGEQVSFIAGETKLIFIQSGVQNPNYHIAFDIPKNKLDEAFQWIKDKVDILPVTADSDIADIKHWNARSFYFYDNNDNLLELICRYDLENESNTAFSGQSILYISEIGLVADNASEMADKLTAKYGIRDYTKQPRMDNFAALGDESGLLIIVNENRDWFPTNKKAEPFWVNVKFSLQDGEHEDSILDTKEGF
jgi:catechol-2,3-dioxygenase